MVDQRKHSHLLQTLQLIVLIIGVGGAFLTLGSKTEILNNNTTELKELKSIVQDLVKSQVSLVTSDVRHLTMLEDIKDRLDALESRVN